MHHLHNTTAPTLLLLVISINIVLSLVLAAAAAVLLCELDHFKSKDTAKEMIKSKEVYTGDTCNYTAHSKDLTIQYSIRTEVQ